MLIRLYLMVCAIVLVMCNTCAYVHAQSVDSAPTGKTFSYVCAEGKHMFSCTLNIPGESEPTHLTMIRTTKGMLQGYTLTECTLTKYVVNLRWNSYSKTIMSHKCED